MKFVADYSMETLYFNVHGAELNPRIRLIENGQMTKKLREFYNKNPALRAFLKGLDKRDEKYIINAMTNVEMESGEQIIRAGTTEKSIIIVAGGEIVAFNKDENVVYQEGAILGVEQFLFDKPWPEDIICKQQATLCKFSHANMIDMIQSNAQAASRLYKRIVRHYCYSQIYEKKKENIHFFKFKNLEDDQLFIDFKLDIKKDKEVELFSLITQARLPDERTKENMLKKDEELSMMPFFLSHEFADILEASKKQLEKARDSLSKQNNGPSGQYKGSFLKDKLDAQNLSRKMAKSAAKKGSAAGSKENTQTLQQTQANTAAAGKKGVVAKKTVATNEDELYTIIEDYKGQLDQRDSEFEALRRKVDKMTEQNNFLRKELTEERLKSITVLSKLNKIVSLKELEANYQVIESGKFFE